MLSTLILSFRFCLGAVHKRRPHKIAKSWLHFPTCLQNVRTVLPPLLSVRTHHKFRKIRGFALKSADVIYGRTLSIWRMFNFLKYMWDYYSTWYLFSAFHWNMNIFSVLFTEIRISFQCSSLKHESLFNALH